MPTQKPQLKFEAFKPVVIMLLFDQPKTGESKFGKWYLYSVLGILGCDPVEYSAFLPESVHRQIQSKGLKANDLVVITKYLYEKEILTDDNKKKVVSSLAYLTHSLDEAISYYSNKSNHWLEMVDNLKALKTKPSEKKPEIKVEPPRTSKTGNNFRKEPDPQSNFPEDEIMAEIESQF